MRLPTVFLLVVSCALGLEQESCYLSEEEEDQCASVCYPIVKPLLRYFEVCQTKDRTNAELQNSLKEINLKYSKLLEQHSAAQDKCTDVALKYAEVQEKLQQTHQELRKSQESLHETTLKYEQVRTLETQITDKIAQIQVLNDRISDLEKSSELGELNKLFSEELEKLQKITKAGQEVKIGKENNDSNVTSVTKVEATNTTTSPSNSEKPIEILPDRCPSKQNSIFTYPEIQIPGLEPFQVGCTSDGKIGAGWMQAYDIYCGSKDSNLTYEEYINGFGDQSGHWFIGLEKLHILTNWKPHEVYLYHFGRDLRCDTFVVGDKSEGYMLKKIDGCTRNTEPCNLIQGTKFSTYDRDEDGNPNHHWAKKVGFGWWFSSGLHYDARGETIFMSIRRKD